MGAPELIAGLAGKRVTQVSAGDEHSACVTESGDVYTWGIGDGGRLGHGDEEEEYTPRPLERMEGKGATHVVCGDEHTMVLTKVLAHELGAFASTRAYTAPAPPAKQGGGGGGRTPRGHVGH